MKNLKISSPINTDFISVVTTFVEQSSLAFGLQKYDALKLTLASEEVYLYLCDVVQGEKVLDITCTGGTYFVSVEFSFDKLELHLQAFNITAVPMSEIDEELKEMGLLIAARSVDNLSLEEVSGERLILRLIKEKSYPPPEEMGLPAVSPMTSFSIKIPTADEIKMFSRLLSVYYKDYPFPDAFKYPGKLVDMVSSSIYAISIATDDKGTIGGGIIWKRMNEKIAEFFGPYLFNQDDKDRMAESLINACLERLARTEIIGIFTRYPTEAFPEGYFEPIGVTRSFSKEGSYLEFSCYYRQLHEDAGTYVYVPKSIASFIENEYGRLVLPRQVYLTDYSGEYRGDYSVFATEFDRERNRVLMRPLWPGEDYLENISRHIAIFEKEGILNCFFEIDLGIPWHSSIADKLIESRFKPCVVIPYGGKSDLVIFQWEP
ncbi:MAG: hypothetical protein N2745_00300 [Syntrophorhabdaceae bacterium]|nr:hypothetical protein [Syntrophorhabdaceae bacterium]